MTLPALEETPDECFIASLDRFRTPKYASEVAALRVLCEMIDKARQDAEAVPFTPTGPCRCSGWGTPTGCPGCGTRSMGG